MAPIATRMITVVKSISFRFTGTPVTTLFGEIEQIPPLARSRAVHLSIDWGLDQAPETGRLVNAMMLPVDTANPPDLGAARALAQWQGQQSYQFVQNTGAGATVLDAVSQAISVTQTMSHADVSIFSKGVQTISIEKRIRNTAWVIMVASTAVNQIYTGVLTVVHELMQRTYPNDAYTWNDDPDEVNQDGVSEIDMDVD